LARIVKPLDVACEERRICFCGAGIPAAAVATQLLWARCPRREGARSHSPVHRRKPTLWAFDEENPGASAGMMRVTNL